MPTIKFRLVGSAIPPQVGVTFLSAPGDWRWVMFDFPVQTDYLAIDVPFPGEYAINRHILNNFYRRLGVVLTDRPDDTTVVCEPILQQIYLHNVPAQFASSGALYCLAIEGQESYCCMPGNSSTSYTFDLTDTPDLFINGYDTLLCQFQGDDLGYKWKIKLTPGRDITLDISNAEKSQLPG